MAEKIALWQILHLIARLRQEIRVRRRDGAKREVGQSPIAGRNGTIAGVSARVMDMDRCHRMPSERAVAFGYHLELVLHMKVRTDHGVRVLLDQKLLRRGGIAFGGDNEIAPPNAGAVGERQVTPNHLSSRDIYVP